MIGLWELENVLRGEEEEGESRIRRRWGETEMVEGEWRLEEKRLLLCKNEFGQNCDQDLTQSLKFTRIPVRKIRFGSLIVSGNGSPGRKMRGCCSEEAGELKTGQGGIKP